MTYLLRVVYKGERKDFQHDTALAALTDAVQQYEYVDYLNAIHIRRDNNTVVFTSEEIGQAWWEYSAMKDGRENTWEEWVARAKAIDGAES